MRGKSKGNRTKSTFEMDSEPKVLNIVQNRKLIQIKEQPNNVQLLKRNQNQKCCNVAVQNKKTAFNVRPNDVQLSA